MNLKLRTLIVAVSVGALSALGVLGCSNDSTGLENPPPGGFAIPIIGKGVITSRFTAEVAVAGNVAYTTTWGFRTRHGNTMYVWDVTGSLPVLSDSVQIDDAETLGDVQISPDGRLVVIATEGINGSIVVLDRSKTPLHPSLISRFSNDHTRAGVHTMKMSMVGGTLYGFLQIDPGLGEKARETIVDMSNPSNITEVYSSFMGRPFVHDVNIRDGFLLAALWNDGMTIFDIGGGNRGGSPAAPAVVGNVSTATGHIHNIWWYHDPDGSKKYAFLGEEGPALVGSTSSGDIHVVDMTDMTAPKEVAKFAVARAGTHNFWVDEQSGVLYAAYYDAGVRALDIRGDLGACSSAEKTVDGFCDLEKMGRLLGKALDEDDYYIWGVVGSGNRLYASDMNNGLVVLDISKFKR